MLAARGPRPQTFARQLSLAEVEEAAREDYKSLMINRPDGEGDEQPTSAETEAKARGNSMRTSYGPVAPGKISDDDVAYFERALSELPKPVPDCFKTGTRTAALWALANASKKSGPDIVAIGKAAGYDLSGDAARRAAAR